MSSACGSHDHIFVQPSRDVHLPTHATGGMPCMPAVADWVPIDHPPAPALLGEDAWGYLANRVQLE